MDLLPVQIQLRALESAEGAATSSRYFKTGDGEYGEGDRFLGVRVPVLRQLSREHKGMALEDVARLGRSPWHEERQLAMFILVLQYKKKDPARREAVYRTYLSLMPHINSWDLVDASAEFIVGPHLMEGDRAVVYQWARSPRLWDRRIAVLSSFAWIKAGDASDSLRLAELLLGDPEDLIHKAVGWMLREIGDRDAEALRAFLEAHHEAMPRTAVRYAVEHLPEAERRRWVPGRSLPK